MGCSTVPAMRTVTRPAAGGSVLLTFGLVLALLAMGYGALFSMLDDIRDTYGVNEGALGAVIGMGFFAGFFAQVLIAPLADRGHARRLVLTGIVVNVAGLLLLAAAHSFAPLLLGRFVMGVGVGVTVPAVRRIVILADPDRVGDNLGRLLAAEVGGFAAGPAVAALLVGRFGIPVPFLVIAVATVIALPFVIRSSQRIVDTEDAPEASQRLAFDLLRIRPYTGALLMGCAVWVMIGSFDALWSVALDDLHAADWIANLGITLFALPLVVFGAAGGRLAQRVGPFRVGACGLFAGAGFMLLYGLVPTGLAMFVVAMVHSVNDGVTVSSTGVAAAMVVPAARQAGAQGLLGGAQTLLAGVTALVAGTVYEQFGRTAAYTVAAGLMIILVTAGITIAGPARRLRGSPGDVPLPAALAADPVGP
jgi:MFS transporter, DHA1 family, tetracycline resistance protein